jgi:hypothetical protein
VISFPTPVPGSEQIANEIIRFSDQTGRMIGGTPLGADSMQRGREILRGYRIPSFDELDLTFRVMGRFLCQRFR